MHNRPSPSSTILTESLVQLVHRDRILPSGTFEEIVGESDRYNPLAILVDNFWRPGGLQDVSDNLHEINMQLYPEPTVKGGGSDDGYFRNGGREDMAFAAFFILPYGPHVLHTYEYVPYSQYGNGRHYARCDYLGSRGFVVKNPAPGCPLIAILDSRTGRR